MTREEFVKQRCEIDKITEEEFEKTYRVVDCNCGAPYCKGYRCLNLDDLLKENQEFKKQFEEKSKEINRNKTLNFINKVFEENTKLKNQQKEFINYINDYIELLKDNPDLVEEGQKDILEEILSKYKEIIGVLDDKTN